MLVLIQQAIEKTKLNYITRKTLILNMNSLDEYSQLPLLRTPSGPRVSVLNSGSVISGIYFSQTSVIYFCRRFNYCPYYRGARNSKVSARRELTVVNNLSNTEIDRKYLNEVDFHYMTLFYDLRTEFTSIFHNFSRQGGGPFKSFRNCFKFPCTR